MRDHEYTYRGPLNDCCASQAQRPLTPDAARKVALEALASGRIRFTAHFQQRALVRRFDLLDVERVIATGKPAAAGVMCLIRKNVKYIFRGQCDGRTLTVVFALDATQSYEETPLAILITGCWKRRQPDTKSQHERLPKL
jgi:Domain of unknown function (DUF4258)